MKCPECGNQMLIHNDWGFWWICEECGHAIQINGEPTKKDFIAHAEAISPQSRPP